jgi:hypothetical protein
MSSLRKNKKHSSLIFFSIFFASFRYDPVSVKVVRQVERQGVTRENPQSYFTRFGNSLLDSKDLIAQARELGIIEDIVCYSVVFFCES